MRKKIQDGMDVKRITVLITEEMISQIEEIRKQIQSEARGVQQYTASVMRLIIAEGIKSFTKK